VFDEEGDIYTVDKWQEKRCPSFVDDGTDEDAGVTSRTEWNLREGQEYKVVVRIFGRNPIAKTDVEESPFPVFSTDRTVEEDAEVLESILNRRYQGGIKVEGIDVSSQRMEEFPEIKNAIKKGMELPIGTINNEVKFIGDVPLDLLKVELEKMGLKPR
jgi:hypothetical protein